jgi:hypothetical protein
MNTPTNHPLHTLWRRLLAGTLVVCVSLAAVPVLAHCCSDRCHDAEPVAAQAGDCGCSLSGVEPPVDVLAYAPDPVADLAADSERVAVGAVPPPARPAGGGDPIPTHRAPDRTVVLLI